MTIYSANDLRISYSSQEGPNKFSDLIDPLILSGAMIEGTRVGSFVGRASQLFLARKILSADLISEIKKASQDEMISVYGQRSLIQANMERRLLFRDDLTKLRRWQMQPVISQSDTKDAFDIVV